MSTSASDLGFVALIAGVAFVFAAGPYCLTYLYYRSQILRAACGSSKGKPAQLFALSILTGYAWLLFPPLIVLMTVFFADSYRQIASSFDGVLMFLVISIPIGALGWIVLAVFHFIRARRYRLYIKDNPPPKFQIWLQDVMIGVFSLGLTMTVIVNVSDLIHDQAAIIVVTVYEIITQFIMFFAILDACRFSAALKAPRARATYLFSLMVVNAFFPLPLLTALAWNVWRRALFLAECPEPLKPITVVKQVAAKPVEAEAVMTNFTNEPLN